MPYHRRLLKQYTDDRAGVVHVRVEAAGSPLGRSLPST